jgi:glycosyltransferase involved in cell wall biosynthesis
MHVPKTSGTSIRDALTKALSPAVAVTGFDKPIHVLYVGRIAPSKGLHDLIPAVAQSGLPRGALRVTIAGNTAWSDPSYLMRPNDLIARHDLEDVVRFIGTIDDAERQRLFHVAHILAMTAKVADLDIETIAPVAGALDDIGLPARQVAFRAPFRADQPRPEAT